MTQPPDEMPLLWAAYCALACVAVYWCARPWLRRLDFAISRYRARRWLKRQGIEL